MNKFFSLVLLLLLTANSYATTIIALNTEWLWDTSEPHEGQVVGYAQDNIRPPSPKEYILETYAIAKTIEAYDADIVGLVEIENEAVAQKIKSFLSDEWSLAFMKGRDSYTGQDVAILTRYDVIPDTLSNLPDFEGNAGGVTKKPSKVIAVGLKDDAGKTYYVVATHFLSKRSNNDTKRLAQADAVRQAIKAQFNNYDHFVVLGDINDLPNSPVLKRLRGLDDQETNLVQPADISEDYSYIYDGRKQLIDHILVDAQLASGGKLETILLPEAITDHRMVVFRK